MSRHWKSASNEDALVPDWTYTVEVCGFTFRFVSLEQIEEYLNYYRQKIHPSSADGAKNRRVYIVDGNGNQKWGAISSRGDHWERQTPFDELPLYLREEPKRLKVIKAFERALKQWRAENDKT